MKKKTGITAALLLMLVAALSWSWASAGSEDVIVYAGWARGQHYEIAEDQNVILSFWWLACSEGLTADFRDSISAQNYTLDGKPLLHSPEDADKYWGDIQTIHAADAAWLHEGCAWPSDRGGRIDWQLKLGKLSPGDHVLTAYRELAFPIIDGGDYDGDGRPDAFTSENYFGLEEKTVTIHVFSKDVGVITGTVIEERSGEPVESVSITACPASVSAEAFGTSPLCTTTQPDNNGFYRLLDLAPGEYRLQIQGSGWESEWFDNQDSFAEATLLPITAGTAVKGIDFALRTAGQISMVLVYRETNADPAEFQNAAQALGGMLAERIGVGVEVFVPSGDEVQSLHQMLELASSGLVDLTLANAFHYLALHDDAGFQSAVGQFRYGRSDYASQLVAHVDSGFGSLLDLEGARFCTADFGASTSYILPTLMLQAAGITPAPEILEVGSHILVLETLYNEDVCDFGATYEDARTNLAGDYPDIYEVLPVIALSPTIPNESFILGPEVSAELEAALVDALLDIADDPEGLAVLQTLSSGLQSLVAQDHSAYVGFADLIADAGTTPWDVWVEYFE